MNGREDDRFTSTATRYSKKYSGSYPSRLGLDYFTFQALLRACYLGQRDYLTASFGNDIFVINYDELVSRPEEHLRRLCDFLNIEFEESLLKPTYWGVAVKTGGSSFGFMSYTISENPNAHLHRHRFKQILDLCHRLFYYLSSDELNEIAKQKRIIDLVDTDMEIDGQNCRGLRNQFWAGINPHHLTIQGLRYTFHSRLTKSKSLL